MITAHFSKIFPRTRPKESSPMGIISIIYPNRGLVVLPDDSVLGEDQR